MLKTQFLDNSGQLPLRLKTISKNGYAQITQGFWSPQCVKEVLCCLHNYFHSTEAGNKASKSDLFCAENSSLEMVGYAEA
ncbi:MAG: hypothetical protein PHI13_03105 [Methylococcales bacterium]|nr:hypothetical protein [Methylococcales bacterium]